MALRCGFIPCRGVRFVRDSRRITSRSMAIKAFDRQERQRPQVLEVGGHRIIGVSIGAVETCICLPGFSLAFDSGRSPFYALGMRYVALTHGHCDHAMGVPLHIATRSLQKLDAATYFVPGEIYQDIENLISAAQKLDRSDNNYNLVELGEGKSVQIRKNWFLKSFPTTHTVPSQGYLLSERRRKLKKQYVNLPGKQLGNLRKAGVEIEDCVSVPQIAFTGDTTLDAIASNDEVRNANILITEMTFLDGASDPATAREFGHIHIEEVIARENIFANNSHVVFTHFSARYKKDDIEAAMRRLPESLRSKSYALTGE